jgi:hypothetical protein
MVNITVKKTKVASKTNEKAPSERFQVGRYGYIDAAI